MSPEEDSQMPGDCIELSSNDGVDREVLKSYLQDGYELLEEYWEGREIVYARLKIPEHKRR